MRVFWSAGYAGASISALGTAMGLQPGSIYAAFGSKGGLFRETLAAYLSGVLVAARKEGDPPRRRIERWFEALVEGAMGDGGRGCLLLHAIADLHHHEAATVEMVQREVERLRAYFAASLGEARPDLPLATHADRAAMLVAALAGISAWSRSGASRDRLDGITRSAMSLVDAPPHLET